MGSCCSGMCTGGGAATSGRTTTEQKAKTKTKTKTKRKKQNQTKGSGSRFFHRRPVPLLCSAPLSDPCPLFVHSHTARPSIQSQTHHPCAACLSRHADGGGDGERRLVLPLAVVLSLAAAAAAAAAAATQRRAARATARRLERGLAVTLVATEQQQCTSRCCLRSRCRRVECGRSCSGPRRAARVGFGSAHPRSGRLSRAQANRSRKVWSVPGTMPDWQTTRLARRSSRGHRPSAHGRAHASRFSLLCRSSAWSLSDPCARSLSWWNARTLANRSCSK